VVDDLEPDGAAEHLFERSGMPVSGPELELRVAAGVEARQVLIGRRVQLDARERLGMAAIQALGEPHHRRQRAYGAPGRPAEIAKALVCLLRRRLPVITGDERDHLDLVRIESPQVAMLDEVVRVPMMALVADVHADVVQKSSILEPGPLAIPEAVHASRLVEDREREPRDLLRVRRPVAAPLGELDDAPAPDVRVTFDRADVRDVLSDIVEHEALAEREVAERDLPGSQTAQDRIEQDRSGDHQIRAPRVEAGHGQPALERQPGEALAQLVERLGANAAVAQLLDGCAPVHRRECSQTQDGARRANHAVEPVPDRGVQVGAHDTVHVLYHVPLVPT
jgi:hypothetical protein